MGDYGAIVLAELLYNVSIETVLTCEMEPHRKAMQQPTMHIVPPVNETVACDGRIVLLSCGRALLLKRAAPRMLLQADTCEYCSSSDDSVDDTERHERSHHTRDEGRGAGQYASADAREAAQMELCGSVDDIALCFNGSSEQSVEGGLSGTFVPAATTEAMQRTLPMVQPESQEMREFQVEPGDDVTAEDIAYVRYYQALLGQRSGGAYTGRCSATALADHPYEVWRCASREKG